MNLYDLMHGPWWHFVIGCCALAVVAALMRNISQQDKPLPPPDRNCVRGEKDQWIVSGGKS